MREGRAIYGIDFSGAKDAGDKIWITRGVPDGEGLLIQGCFRARDLPNSGRALKVCMSALVNLVQSDPNTVFGFDFPFGLPASLFQKNTWGEFVLAFPSRFKDPDDLRRKCSSKTGNKELRRQTDKEARTPFSPYNLRLYKQTYYGISKVLARLVRDASACILPFQEPVPNKPWILEVCPASTLRNMGLNGLPYKGRSKVHRKNRLRILDMVQKAGSSIMEQSEFRNRIIANKNGDALDSVIVAMAVFIRLQNSPALIPKDPVYSIEGHIYWRV